MKQNKCHECWGLNGHHWTGCTTRGYSFVGPHPSAPDTERAPTPSSEIAQCPCGRARAGCDFHDPTLQPVAAPAPDLTGRARADAPPKALGAHAFTWDGFE